MSFYWDFYHCSLSDTWHTLELTWLLVGRWVDAFAAQTLVSENWCLVNLESFSYAKHSSRYYYFRLRGKIEFDQAL